MTVRSDVYFGLLLYFKLARVVMGNVSKKGEKYEKYLNSVYISHSFSARYQK